MSTSNYPTSADDSSSLPNPTTASKTNSPSHAALHTTENDAIKALEAKVGTGATTPAANTMLRGTGTGTTAWGQLSSSQFAAVLSDETGSGLSVFNNTPTLITPKVDTINENTTDNGVSIDGLNIKDSVLNTNNSVQTSNIQSSAVTTAALADGAVTPAKLLAGTGTSWAWQTWSPTYANLTVGNGTVISKYTQIGKTVHVFFKFTLGITSVIGTTPSATFPVPPVTNYYSEQTLGFADFVQTGSADWIGTSIYDGTTPSFKFRTIATPSGSNPLNLVSNSGNQITATAPFTWGSTHILATTFTYQAA